MYSATARDFSLAKTMECGQFFRYRAEGNGYVVSHRDRIFYVEQSGDSLSFEGIARHELEHFFRLDEDYRAVVGSISKDSYIRQAIKENYGLRLIRQDPWECLISYICSQNSNIPRIRKNLHMIAERFGRVIDEDGRKGHTFPYPGQLDDLEEINQCRVGFRARYIHDANSRIDGKALGLLSGMGYEEAKAELKKIIGVGDKVADCVLLFSLGKDEAFPVDVWIKRVMGEQYGDMITRWAAESGNGSGAKRRIKGQTEGQGKSGEGIMADEKVIARFGREYFGSHAGYANQFLFHYRRSG